MRPAFFRTLLSLVEHNPRVIFITGDLGFGVVEPFRDRFPLQYVNVGVAEQNMAGIGAGMALSGRIVFSYSIGNFPTLRCLEQIRNDICYHRANVKIVSVGGGLAYGSLGPSHHATEDLAIMRALPNMLVVAPGDPIEAELATRAVAEYAGPCYLRLGRAGEPSVHVDAPAFSLGVAIKVREGRKFTLISTGAMLKTAVTVADRLTASGIATRVLSMHTISPLDVQAVLAAAEETDLIATVEEHSVVGGLGGAVAEVLAESPGRSVPFRRFGLPSGFRLSIGSQEYLKKESGLDHGGLFDQITEFLRAPLRARLTV